MTINVGSELDSDNNNMDPSPISIPPDSCPLLIVQYALEGHFRRTEHWSLAVLELSPPLPPGTFSTKAIPARAVVHLYQVVGNIDTFEFAYSNMPYLEFTRDPSLRGGCLLGFVPSPSYSNITWLKTNLRHAIPVRRGCREWDCQDWVLDCIQWLKQEKPEWEWVLESKKGLSQASIQEELEQEKQRWEDVVDVVYERLINSESS